LFSSAWLPVAATREGVAVGGVLPETARTAIAAALARAPSGRVMCLRMISEYFSTSGESYAKRTNVSHARKMFALTNQPIVSHRVNRVWRGTQKTQLDEVNR
jgi:hypothetical protein